MQKKTSIQKETFLQGFPSESLVFCPKMLKKMSILLIRSFLVSDLSSRLLISSERPERIALGRSFLVSEMSDTLTSLTKKEEMSKNEQIANFFEFLFLNP